MSLSMYQASIPAFVQMLNSLAAILDKAEAHAGNRKIDPEVLLNYRLAPDMLPFVRQIQIAADLGPFKLALYIYTSGVDPETADSAVEQVLSAYKDCVRVLGRDLFAEVKNLMPASQHGV